MAEDGNIAVEINPTAINQEILSDENPLDLKKTSNPTIDQKDSRATISDGAQSPASSTYADCEETDSPNSTSLEEVPNENKENLITKNVELTISEQNNQDDDDSCLIVSEKTEPEDTKSIQNDNVEVLPDGTVENELKIEKEDVEVKTENHELHNGDYEEVNSEDYDVEGCSGDEFKSNDSLEDHDRENGDGEEINQEEAIQKKLDDDEDRRNPQYIPKRGFFYEHDDRTAGTGSENEGEGTTKEPPVPEPESKRKGRRSIPDGRWQHDLYKEDEQKSKSAQELIDIYGYDIRNEESAPKARRRRKYGRGPNRYTRKWDDENAYAKQTGASFRSNRRQKPLPVQREEYDAEFPELDRKPRRGPATREHRKSPKRSRNRETVKSDSEIRHKEERRRTPVRKVDHAERPSRSFVKRIPNNNIPTPREPNLEKYEANDIRIKTKISQPKSMATGTRIGPRGRGIVVNKTPRYTNNVNEYELRPPSHESRSQFIPTSRGRGRRIDAPNSSRNFFAGKPVNNEELRELSEQIEQMSVADLKSWRTNASMKGDVDRRPPNEQLQEPGTSSASTIRSKRYSYQRQRLLPDNSNEKNIVDTNLHSVPNVQSIAGHNVANMVPAGDSNGMHHVVNAPSSHKTVPLIAQSQLTSAPPSDTTSLPVNAASVPSNSFAVSASLMPLSASPMTASGAALQAGAAPLPLMGFFQHPQGFTNQGTAAQIYTREQNIIGASSSQPVQLVTFLPASPILPNTNHTQSATAAPPPPPPPPTYPTSVISYPQASPTQQTQATFNSETYQMPPVTLAPIHQAELYQSRGGVTYYNTRSQVKSRSPPPPRIKTAIPIVPPPNESNE